MKLIGIDYGKRRIGLAVSDEIGTCVRGYTVIDRKKTRQWQKELQAAIKREQPAGIVIGLPLDADDRETAMAAEIRKFAANLEKNSAIPVYFIDESLTSKRAADLLRYRKKKVRRDKRAVDRIAACLILESFLRENTCAH
ncbi:MAG: Holliday junction resolvase RuvX [Chitinispirillaceae bacterium]|nr:Holliday junction resolvase RuvX [Chitinispirillaceae bacterium]